jgi:hypothetical protein
MQYNRDPEDDGSETATPAEIETAYRHLAKEDHPDEIPEEFRDRPLGQLAAEAFGPSIKPTGCCPRNGANPTTSDFAPPAGHQRPSLSFPSH